MLASTMRPSGATSSTGLGSALRDGLASEEQDGDVLRLVSCSSTPCKIVECVLKRSMHACRLVGGQDRLTPVLQARGRGTAVLGGDFQRPAEMFARMPEPDAQAVMAQDRIVERAGYG